MNEGAAGTSGGLIWPTLRTASGSAPSERRWTGFLGGLTPHHIKRPGRSQKFSARPLHGYKLTTSQLKTCNILCRLLYLGSLQSPQLEESKNSSTMADPVPQPSKHLFLVVTWTLKPEHVEAWLEAEFESWQTVHSQPECLFFEILRDPLKPNSFRLLECWNKDREWFDNVQVRTPPYQKLAEKTLAKDIIEEPLKIEYFERMGPDVNGSVIRQGYLDGGRFMD